MMLIVYHLNVKEIVKLKEFMEGQIPFIVDATGKKDLIIQLKCTIIINKKRNNLAISNTKRKK